jgi:Pyridine nucleotide-disulphide oxidoreductase
MSTSNRRLYQMATCIVGAGDVAPPIRDILRRHSNTRVLLGDMVDVDLDAREVTLEAADRSTRVAYDTLIVAAGARQSYFGHDEFGVHAPGLKTIDDALEVRGRIFGAFELAELEQDERQRDGWLTIAVIGAGPTGVDVAGQIVELSRRALTRNFHERAQPGTARARPGAGRGRSEPARGRQAAGHCRPAVVDGAGGRRAKPDAARRVVADRGDPGLYSRGAEHRSTPGDARRH